MTIAAILVTAMIAYAIGYRRGHVAALAVPYAMLAAKMEELMGRKNESHSEINE